MAGENDDDNAQIDDTGADDTATAVELTEAEQIASEMGWKPQADYKGDPDKWKPAKDYILTERDVTKTLKETVKDLKGTVDRMANASAKQTERALQQQAEHYEQMLEQAVEDGDKEAAKQARQGLREAEREIERHASNPEDSFAKDNPWYMKDEDATAYAVSISQREAKKGASVEEQLKAAQEGVRKRFPELFDDEPKQPQRKAPEVNAPSSRSTSARKGDGYGDMPPEARRAADDNAELFFRKFKVPVEQTKAQYAKDYFANRSV